MGILLSSCENVGVDVCSDSILCSLVCGDGIVLRSKYPSKSQVFLDRLNDGVDTFGMRFTPYSVKCCYRTASTQTQDLLMQKRNWAGEVGFIICLFTYHQVVVCRLKFLRTQKDRFVSTNFKHLRRPCSL